MTENVSEFRARVLGRMVAVLGGRRTFIHSGRPQTNSRVAFCACAAVSAIGGSLTGLIALRGPRDRAGGFPGRR